MNDGLSPPNTYSMMRNGVFTNPQATANLKKKNTFKKKAPQPPKRPEYASPNGTSNANSNSRKSIPRTLSSQIVNSRKLPAKDLNRNFSMRRSQRHNSNNQRNLHQTPSSKRRGHDGSTNTGGSFRSRIHQRSRLTPSSGAPLIDDSNSEDDEADNRLNLQELAHTNMKRTYNPGNNIVLENQLVHHHRYNPSARQQNWNANDIRRSRSKYGEPKPINQKVSLHISVVLRGRFKVKIFIWRLPIFQLSFISAVVF